MFKQSFVLIILTACETYPTQGPVAITVTPVWTDEFQCAKGILTGGYDEYTRSEFAFGPKVVDGITDTATDELIANYGMITWNVEATDWLKHDQWTITTLWWNDTSYDDWSCTDENEPDNGSIGERYFTTGMYYNTIDCAPTSGDPLAMYCVTTTQYSDTGSL